MSDDGIFRTIEAMLAEPVFFRDILAALEDRPYRVVLRAWSDIREAHDLQRDELGRYSVKAGVKI